MSLTREDTTDRVITETGADVSHTYVWQIFFIWFTGAHAPENAPQRRIILHRDHDQLTLTLGEPAIN